MEPTKMVNRGHVPVTQAGLELLAISRAILIVEYVPKTILIYA